ncbi:thioredoxin domain-containing protein [Leptolyngbya sp. FACHB-16]|uniref:DsbA family protein n=1 Tax=unclassified Leptolyngbya TaxID=2650499 RepID=UPI001682A0AB|nr:thioredoxin domain-containing protein [Leptolyngbya sp. FACHB-16]MBD2158894.1 DsbA family protein [Leptolyngbya sp. FACHB-16]
MNQNNDPYHLFVPPSQDDHYQGLLNAPVVLVEYGNYQCLECKKIHQLIQIIQQYFASVLSRENEICVVFRHFIEGSIHPQAQKAAEAVEAAAVQGQFWQMHDMLFMHQQELGNGYLVEYADYLGLDICQFLQDISKQVHVDRINADIAGGLSSGILDAPALFINGMRYIGQWDTTHLISAITTASHES